MDTPLIRRDTFCTCGPVNALINVRGLAVPGGIPLYKLYRYVQPHWVGFLRRFGLKTGIRFAHFSIESGRVFEGRLRECMELFIVSIPNE